MLAHACSCLLMLARAQLVLPGAQPVPACPACAQSRKIQFWEGVIFLHKLFTQSMIFGWKWPTSKKNLESWVWGNPKIQILEDVTFLHMFFPQKLWYICWNAQNRKILKFARACWCSACACWCSACKLRLCSVPKIQFWEGATFPLDFRGSYNPILGRCHFPV